MSGLEIRTVSPVFRGQEMVEKRREKRGGGGKREY